MDELVFITGNQNKANFLSKWLGRPIAHQKVDLDEIQSTDLREIVADKARRAYEIVKKPVLVEDVSMQFAALKGLPGPFIKWFNDAGMDTLCRMLDGFADRSAEGHTLYGLFDGSKLELFEGVMRGIIADAPRGTGGFGFDAIFINEGQKVTRAEMDETTYVATSYRTPAIHQLKAYLDRRAN